MNIQELENRWNGLKPESNGSFKSLRISADCVPDLFIGVDATNVRCLILKLPLDHSIDFQSVIRQNLSIELFRETHWIILKLRNSIYADLFNDLILSLYHKIKEIGTAKDYAKIFIETFYKWSEFFEDSVNNQLSEETIKGIFGEMLFLSEMIKQRAALHINDTLLSWQGLYDRGHDFIFNEYNAEVKTKEQSVIDVRISSEFQLQPETGKRLELVVVNVVPESSGISLKELLMSVRSLIIERLGDFSIILKALAQKGISLINISEYDQYKYIPVNIITYDCLHDDFPKILASEISSLINSVRYSVRISELDRFIINKKEF